MMVPRRFTARVLALVLALLGAATVVRAQPTGPFKDVAPREIVRSVQFPGAHALDPKDLALLLQTRASSCRLVLIAPVCKLVPTVFFVKERYSDTATVKEDVTRLRVIYWQHGYREARVVPEIARVKRGITITFHIDEGPPTLVGSLDIQRKDSVLSDAELARRVGIRVGEPVNILAIDSTLTELRDALWDKGYPDAVVDTTMPPPDSARRVAIGLKIDPRWRARVGRIVFTGNERLSDETLRRGMTLRPGDIFTRREVLETQRRLYEAPLLRQALVVLPAAGDSLKTMEVTVREQPPHRLRGSVGFNTIDFAQVAVDAAHRDFLGGARSLDVRAAVGNLLAPSLNGRAIFRDVTPASLTGRDEDAFLRPTWQASARLVQPWAFSPGSSVELSAFTGRRAIPGVVIDRSSGVGLGVVDEVMPRTPIGVGYRFESTRVEGSDVLFCAAYGVCDAPTAAALRGTQRLAPVALSAWIDRTNDLENPTRGHTLNLDIERADAATGSTYRYTRVEGAAMVVKPLGSDQSTLAVRVHAGWVRPDRGVAGALGLTGVGNEGILHPRKRFYAGGAQSVRGFAESQLGPRVLEVRREALVAAGCSEASITDRSCDPNTVPTAAFEPQPLGGSSLLEGSVEWRRMLAAQLGVVVFVDGARVGVPGINSLAPARGALTPGLGFRAQSPLGLLRLDFGFRTGGSERLPVLVADETPDAGGRVAPLAIERRYDPIDVAQGTLGRLRRRIVVHFAMGQAF